MRRSTHPLWQRYGIAVLACTLAALLTLALKPALDPVPAVLFFPAIVVSAWYGGRWPGVLAGVMTSLWIHWQTAPANLLNFELASLVRTAIFVFVSMMIGVFVAERRRIEEQLDRQLAQLETVYRTSESASRAARLEQVYAEALDHIQKALSANRASILLFDADGVMRFKAWRGLSDAYRARTEGHSPWSRESRDPQPVLVADVTTDPSLAALRDPILSEGIHALGFFPLVAEDQLLGKFMVYYDAPHVFSADETQLAQTIAQHLALALQRKQSEEALRASNAILNAVIEGTTDDVYVKDRQGRYLLINSTGARSIGQPPEEVIGKDDTQLLSPTEARVVMEDDQRVMAQGLAQTLENLITLKGEMHTYQSVKAPYRDAQGNVIGIIGVSRNISDLKRTEQTQRVLAEAGKLLGMPLTVESRLTALAQLVVPTLADWCAIDMVEAEGTTRRGAVAHRDPAQVELADKLYRQYPPDWTAPRGLGHVLCTGQSELYSDISDEMLQTDARAEAHLKFMGELRLKSLLIAPLNAGGRTLGALTLAWAESDRRYTPADLALVEELAHRTALALDHARLYEAEQHARRSAEQVAQHLSRLQRVTAALSKALTSAQVAEVIVNEGIAAFSAQAGMLLLVAEGGVALKAVSSVGDLDTPGDQPIPSLAPVIAADVIRDGKPLWLESQSAFTERYPRFAEARAALSHEAAAGIPLGLNGTILGVLVLGFAEVRTFDAGERNFLLTLGQQCAQALDRTDLYEAEQRARHVAEEAAERTTRLQAITAALSRALTPAQVAAVIVEEAVAAYEARSGTVMLVSEDGTDLEWAQSVGYPEEIVDHYRRVPLSAPIPAAEVTRTGQPVFIESPADFAQRYPQLASARTAFSNQAVALIPLDLDGRVLGTMVLGFSEQRGFDAEDRNFMLTLGRQGAQALERARLYETERQVRRAAEEAAERTGQLQTVTAALAEALTPAQVAEVIVHEAVGAYGARSGKVMAVSEDGRSLEWVQSLGYPETIVERFRRTSLKSSIPAAEVARTGQPVWIESRDDYADRYPGWVEARAPLGNEAAVFLPLNLHEDLIGVMALGFSERRTFDAKDRDFLLTLSRQCAQALERARLYEAERRVRRAAEQAAARIALLQTITAALSEALTPGQVARAIIDRGVAALDASAGYVALVAEGGEEFEIVAHVGYAQDTMEKWRRFPLALPTPLGDSARLGQPVWVESPEKYLDRYPALDPDAIASHNAWAALPLLAEGRAIGAIGLSFPAAREFSPEDRDLMSSLARQCAQAIERTRLYAAESLARAEAEAAQQRLELLADASSVLTASLDYETTLQGLARLILPRLADLCTIYIAEPGGPTRLVAVAHVNPDQEVLLRELSQRHVPGPDMPDSRIGAVLRSGTAVCLSDLPETVEEAIADEELRSLYRRLHLRSALIVPFSIHGQVLGAIGLNMAESGRRYGQTDLALAEELARHVALAVDNALLYQEAQRLNADLEQRIARRTAQLQVANAQLQEEAIERKRAQVELAEVQRRLMDSREAERVHLARELHDGPVQALYGISYRLEGLREILREEEDLAYLAAGQAMLQQVIEALRAICGELRPPTLTPFGLEAAIRSDVERFRILHPDLKVQLELMPDEQRLPEPVRLALFRIYQQTLANVARHAEAHSALIRLVVDAEQARLEIQDDGRGFEVPTRWLDLAREGHLGLIGAVERAEAIGGQLKIVSRPGEGTQIQVSVPFTTGNDKAQAAESMEERG